MEFVVETKKNGKERYTPPLLHWPFSNASFTIYQVCSLSIVEGRVAMMNFSLVKVSFNTTKSSGE